MYTCIRKILVHVTDFNKFWKQEGPFEFALTSSGFPPLLLEPEEWLFANDKIALIKGLMQFSQRKMAFWPRKLQKESQSRTNPSVSFTPEDMIPWRIAPFPEEWNSLECPAFLPQGYLTRDVLKQARILCQETNCVESQILKDISLIERAFFEIVAAHLPQMGYEFLSHDKESGAASLGKYLREWEEDELDAQIDPPFPDFSVS